MTETHFLKTWNDFRPLVQDIVRRYSRIKIGSGYEVQNPVVFRGQADSNWPLSTTLERYSIKEFSVEGYVLFATECCNELESLTGKTWNVPSYSELMDGLRQTTDSFHIELPCYDYLVYLRHHGFPSPLLDWTESPYVAAYFALCDPVSSEFASVYVYVESLNGGHGLIEGESQIKLCGKFVTTHARHFSQRATYTIAAQFNKEARRHIFCPHARIFDQDEREQDLLIQINIPASERVAALRDLNDVNINHYSLFHTEDSLVRTLASRIFDLKQ